MRLTSGFRRGLGLSQSGIDLFYGQFHQFIPALSGEMLRHEVVAQNRNRVTGGVCGPLSIAFISLVIVAGMAGKSLACQPQQGWSDTGTHIGDRLVNECGRFRGIDSISVPDF